jgi:hypothetical protein
MPEITERNFGLAIAFWLPGFVLLWGLSYSLPEARIWLSSSESADPTIGRFLYATVASLILGLLVSAVRWVVIDHILQFFEPAPAIDFSKLKKRETLEAFTAAVENHYRYYQYYSNLLIAIILSLVVHWLYSAISLPCETLIIVALICVTLFVAARDSRNKYNSRASAITK